LNKWEIITFVHIACSYSWFILVHPLCVHSYSFFSILKVHFWKKKKSLISRKSFNFVLAFLIIWRFLHSHESYFVWKKKCIFPFFFEMNLVELEILKLHHSLHKTNNLFYIMRFTSSFSLCHLEFHKNMLKPRSICVTSFDFLHWWFKVVQFSLQSYYYMWSMIPGCQPWERLMFLPCNNSQILHDSTRAMDVIKLLNLLNSEPNLSRWEMIKLMGFSLQLCDFSTIYIYRGCVAMIGPPTHYFSGGHPNNWVWMQMLGLLSLFWCGCWLYSHQNSGWPTKLIRQKPFSTTISHWRKSTSPKPLSCF